MNEKQKLVRVVLPSLVDGEPLAVPVNEVHERLLQFRVVRIKKQIEFEKWAKTTLGENYEKTIRRIS